MSVDVLPPAPFKARVLHDYEPIEAKEIPLLSNTVVNVLRTHDSGWWKGEWNGKTGWFPSSHVTPVPADAAPGMGAIRPAPRPASIARQAAAGSSATMARISAILSKFFSKRPKKSELEKRGVLTSERTRVFGKTLADIVARDNEHETGVPTFLVRALDHLWAHGLDIEGLFRISPLRTELTGMQEMIDHDPKGVEFTKPSDAVLVSGVVKLFIRSHPEPIFPPALYADLLRVGTVSEPVEGRIALAAQTLLSPEMPRPNRLFVCRLLALLHECIKHEDVMRMTANAYGTVFGVVLVTTCVETSGTILADLSQQVGCIAAMITHWDQIAPVVGVDMHGVPVNQARVAAPVAAAAAAPTPPPPAGGVTKGALVRVLFDFAGSDTKKISLTAGEILLVDRDPENGWVKGRRTDNGVPVPDAERGWFPASYVALYSGN